MKTSKVFVKKTKRGTILKIVREHYLRTDLTCGSYFCKKCFHAPKDLVLDEVPEILSSTYNFHHYLLLDTNIILDQMDILETKVISNVILLQTVLEEVRNRSSTIYKRIIDLVGDKNKYYTFVNEHHRETHVESKDCESTNDRNDRAIRRAVEWYNEHLTTPGGVRLQVLLITDDKNNRDLAIAQGLTALSMKDYVKTLDAHQYLLDKLSHKSYDADADGKTRAPLFPAHLSAEQVHIGIKSGKLLQGVFYASRDNFLEGTVNVDGMDKSVLLQGHEGLNRAVDGDHVAIEMLPEKQWSAPSEVVMQDDGGDPGDVNPDEEQVLESAVKGKEKTPTGKVVAIIRRNWRQYCGVIQLGFYQGATNHIFLPAERKIPKIRIETRQADILASQRIIVAIDSWSRYSRYPKGHFVRALGEIGDKDTENEVLLLEHDIPHTKFSDAVLACLPKMPWAITKEDEDCRVDLRNICICSVDPPGCTDIDDALHCFQLPNGNYEVGVHIADVSHFIRPGTALDKEASRRGTTVYLTDKRLDMVPELLSSNLCSLRGQEERLAFSCIWELSPDAQILSTRFHKSIICSKRAMTYEEAQLIIDDASHQDDLALGLRGLNNLAKKLKKQRTDNGALVLASPEVRFHVDSETHEPLEVVVKKLRETNSMVEEFMLLANISVATRILAEFPECAILRRHPTPPISNFEPLMRSLKTQGFDLDTTSGKAFSDSLDKAVKPENPFFNNMVRILATRCMLQAVYFCSGMIQPDEYKHYGLAVPIYTHFTSPIRRYADIMVHRLLAVCIGADHMSPEMLDKSFSNQVCKNLNYRNRMAQYAGRASVALHTHLFFRNKIQDEQGYILYVRKNALLILIPKYGLEGTVYVSPKKGEVLPVTFVYDEENQTQTCGSVVFSPFDPVKVQLSLDQSDRQREKLVFKLVEPVIPGFSVPSVGSPPEEPMEVEIVDEKVKPAMPPAKRSKRGKR